MTHSQQQRMTLEHRRQEERRQDQSKRLTQERQMQASLLNEQRMEEKRHLRMLQDEQHERQLQEALRKVGLSTGAVANSWVANDASEACVIV